MKRVSRLLTRIEEKTRELEVAIDQEGIGSSSVIAMSQELDVLVYNCQQLGKWEIKPTYYQIIREVLLWQIKPLSELNITGNVLKN